ncbi:bifunctional fatty acid transporter and acyl-CoA synthetase [Stipitochalara longipes BDJ]|nr:bifunctional fatty acid transporter and acyl-CoA synthetase [Stipitochalara longipes BDJ]
MTSLSAPQVLTAVASLLGAGYLDARYGVSYDLRKLSHARLSKKRIGERIRELGDEATLYRVLELANQGAEALWFEGQSLTYGQMKTKVDRLAEFLRKHGVQAGHVVGVFCTNSPEMAFTIYALGKIGAIAALLNSALRNETLKHCIDISGATLIVGTPDLVEFVPGSIGVRELRRFALNLGYVAPISGSSQRSPSATGIIPIGPDDLASLSPDPAFPRPVRTAKDIWILMFTSGTTGKPKAVSLKTFLLLAVSTPNPQDTQSIKKYYPVRTYCCLPLFHATGFLTGLAHSCGVSGTLCLSRHFSASTFSHELASSRATRLLYVGELLRYALAAPPSPYDTAHQCIVAAGNGLQADVWTRFQTRFGVPEIREFYRSTESVAGFDNTYSGAIAVGKVGFHGVLRRYLEDTMFLVKCDVETESLYRDPETGFCVEAAAEEPGEAIGRVVMKEFYSDYYQNPTATSTKLEKDVFKKGDLFQRMGDLLVRDRDGWVRFHERTGDTFRWRGENVSSAEVKGFMVQLPNIHDIVVYGTKVSGYDGQVGTAGITLLSPSPAAENAYLSALYPHLQTCGLPDYAIPRLIRFTKQIDFGITFKHAKDVLKMRDWRPRDGDEDHLYWLDGKQYRKLDEAAWKLIFETARARL